jgi:hypothetical protein
MFVTHSTVVDEVSGYLFCCFLVKFYHYYKVSLTSFWSMISQKFDPSIQRGIFEALLKSSESFLKFSEAQKDQR